MAKTKKTKKAAGHPVRTDINSEWFRSEMEICGVSQRALADRFDVDPSSVSLMLTGKRAMKVSEAVVFSRLFSQPLEIVLLNAGLGITEELLGPRGASSRIYSGAPSGAGSDETQAEPFSPEAMVPVVGYASGDLEVHAGEPRGPKMVPSLGGEVLERHRALRIIRPSLKFQALDGATIHFLDQGDHVEPTTIGKFSVVKLKSGEVFLRVIKKGYQPGRFDLLHLSGEPSHEDVLITSSSLILGMKL